MRPFQYEVAAERNRDVESQEETANLTVGQLQGSRGRIGRKRCVKLTLWGNLEKEER